MRQVWIAFASLMLFDFTTLYAAGGEAGGSSLMDFVWKVVNVIVLIAILVKFGKKPISDALGNSATSAKKEVDEARNAESRVNIEIAEMRKKLSGLEQEAVEMVEVAKKDAIVERQRIIEEGKVEIARMKEHASFALEQEKRKAEYDLRHWIAEESVKLAEEKLKQDMNDEHHTRLVKNYMDQLQQPEGAL